jgi:hypothetical protein
MEENGNPVGDQTGRAQGRKIKFIPYLVGAVSFTVAAGAVVIVWNLAVNLLFGSPTDFPIRFEWRYFPGIALGFFAGIDSFRNTVFSVRSALQTDDLQPGIAARPKSPRATGQNFISKLLFVLGIAAISYGAARSQIVPEILSVQEQHFDRYFREHAGESTNVLNEVFQLRKRVLMAGGAIPGWSQAIFPTALGLALLATGYYVSQQKSKGTNDPPS